LRAELKRRYPDLTGAYYKAFGADALRQVTGFRGMRDLPRITEGLLRRGYSREDVAKVLGGNLLRVYATVWRDNTGGASFTQQTS
jgi:membrane dipeptidase